MGVTEKVAAMEEQAKTMGVLSLNAAIEAGRMGDSGRKFVMVAEEVRSSAGEYRRAAQELAQELSRMQEAFQTVAGQLKQLAEKDACMEKALGEADQCLAQLIQERQPAEGGQKGIKQKQSDSGRLEKLHKGWEQSAGIAARQENYFEQILRQMEAAGASYMKEQQLLEQLKSWQEQIQNAIKEREAWG